MAAPVVYDYIRYLPKTFKLMFSDGTYRDIEPNTISRIGLEYHYEQSFMPVFKVEFATDFETYFRMIEDKLKLNVQFRLDFYPHTKDSEKDARVRTWFNEKFSVYLENDTPQVHDELTKELLKQNKSGGDDTSDAVTNKFINVAVFLFLDKYLDWAYGYDQAVISKANMTDVLTHTFQSMGLRGIMTPLDNTNTYSQIYLPPMARIDLIKYLNAQYGFYDYGYKFFIDFDQFYMLSKKKGTTAWVMHEYRKVIFNIRKSNDGDRFADGSKLVEKESTVYINVLPSKITVESPSIMNNMLIGNALTSIATAKKAVTNVAFETSNKGKQMKAFMDNKYNNPFAEKEFAHNLEADSRIITFNLNMSNLHWYRPNKQFIINFENKDINKVYGGEYKLSTVIASLYTSGTFMENEIVVQFRK